MNKYLWVLFFACGLVFTKANQDSLTIVKLLNKAEIQQKNFKYDETQQTLLEALQKAQKTNQEALAFKVEIAIANMHLMKNELAQAANFFENKFPKSSYPKNIQSYYYHRKAFYYNQSKQHPKALETAKVGIAIAQANNLTSDLISLYNEIAFTYEHQGKFILAQEYYDKALELSENDLLTHSDIFLNKARLLSQTKNYHDSNKMLEELLSKIDSTKFYNTKMHSYGLFSYNYQMLGDSTNYYKYRFLNRDAALNVQKEYSETQYRELQLQYQTKEKDELIAKKDLEEKQLWIIIIAISVLLFLVGAFNVVTKRKNERLKKLLENNNFLLKELNHRTKNNLQLIVSLGARELNKTSKGEITSLTNLTSKIESIATLHQQLYINERLEFIQLKNYVSEILENLSPFIEQNKIALIEEVEAIEINSNPALYIGLLINELVINSLKHAFEDEEKKTIKIKIFQENKNLVIIYSDNGKGVVDTQKIKLVRTLSHQLGNHYKIENKDGFYYQIKIKL